MNTVFDQNKREKERKKRQILFLISYTYTKFIININKIWYINEFKKICLKLTYIKFLLGTIIKYYHQCFNASVKQKLSKVGLIYNCKHNPPPTPLLLSDSELIASVTC